MATFPKGWPRTERIDIDMVGLVDLGGDDRARAREIIHDLRNALGLVINYSVLVTNELADRTDLVEDLTEIGTAGRRAAELVGQLAALLGPGEG